MLNLSEFHHNHHPSGVKMLAKFIRRGIRVIKIIKRNLEMKNSKLLLITSIILASLLVSCNSQNDQSEPALIETIFASEKNELQPGECTVLHWEVKDGIGAVLLDEQIPLNGEKEICPQETRIYELLVDMETYVETYSLEISVIGNEIVIDAEGENPVVPGEGEAMATEETGEGESDILEITAGTPAYQSNTWVTTGGPPGGLGYDIRMDPRNPDIMYVTDAWAGAFKSIDGGATWFTINNGITARTGDSGDGIPVFSLTVDPNNPDTLWLGTQFSGGVFRSDDAGQNWRPLSNGIQEYALTIRGFTVEPGNSDVVYLGGEISSWEWNGEGGLPGLGLDMTKGAVYKTTDGGQNWNRIWYGDNLARYIWIHPDNHDLIYVSTGIFDREAANSDPVTLDPGGVGILRSYDGGNNWEVLGPENGFQEDELYIGSLFMHPEDPNILIAAAGNDTYQTALGRDLGAIYLTDDGGDTWDRVLALNNASVVEMCLGNPDVIYAGSVSGVYRSNDGGNNWTEIGGRLWGSEDTIAGFPIDLQCDPRDPMRIFVNNYIGGNLLSEDGGVTWRVSSKGYTGALMAQIDVAKNNSALVFSSSRMGMFTSDDGGANWTGTAFEPARLPEGIVVSVDTFDPDHILTVFIEGNTDIMQSRDGGKSWSAVTTGVWDGSQGREGIVTNIVFSPYDRNLVFATAGAHRCYIGAKVCEEMPGYGILRSVDGGTNWSRTSLTSEQVFDIKVVSETLAYAVVFPNILYRSTDDGQTWQIVSQDISSQLPSSPNADPDSISLPVMVSIAVDPTNGDKLFAGFMYGGLLVSSDRGQSWKVSASGLPPETSILNIEVDAMHPGLIYLGSPDSGVFYSVDYGETWVSINEGLTTRTISDLSLSSDGSVLYAATLGGGVLRLGNPVE